MIVKDNSIFILATFMRKSTTKIFFVSMIVIDNTIFILVTFMKKSATKIFFCFYDSYRQHHIFSSYIQEKIYYKDFFVSMIVIDNTIFILVTFRRKSTTKIFFVSMIVIDNHIFVLATFMRKFTRI